MRKRWPTPARGRIGPCVLLWASIFLCSARTAQTKPAETSPDNTSPAPQALQDQIEAAVQPVLAIRCRVGARILRLPQGDVVYGLNADELFKPASNMKVLMTAAALAILGPDFRFRTVAALRGEDLVIIGDGDPGLGDPRLTPSGTPITDVFHQWADILKAKNSTEINGDLVIDDSIFDNVFRNPNWNESDLQSWYAAPVGGLNFNDNCIDTWVYPSANGKTVEIEMTPRLTTVEVINTMGIGRKPPPSIRRLGPGLRFQLSGRIAERTALGPVTVDDPGLFFADACRTSLAAKGIRIAGVVRRAAVRDRHGRLPDDYTILATYETPLHDVLARANKDSQNLFAECLFKRIGHRYALHVNASNPVGSQTTGQAAMKEFVDRLGPSPVECVFDDGSGLSEANRVSPAVVTRALYAMYASPGVRDLYVGTLSVCGEDGTLKKRMKDIAGKVHAKTGYIRGTRTLSGYVEGADGQWYAFSVLFDSIQGGTGPMDKCHDQICRILATWKPK